MAVLPAPLPATTQSGTAAPAGPGYAESFGRGAAQGASLGFADELTGAGSVAGSAMGDAALASIRARGYEVPSAQEMRAVTPGYEQARDASREKYAAAQAENPMMSLLGELIGGLATGGAGGAKAAAGVGLKQALPRLAGLGAGLGGAAGAGYSEAETAPEVAKDAAMGAGIGGAAGLVLPATGAAISRGASELFGLTFRYPGASPLKVACCSPVARAVKKRRLVPEINAR